MKREFLAFLVTGGIAAALNVSARVLLSQFIDFEYAVVVAYLIGMVAAWILARAFVFQSSGRGALQELGRFAVVNAMSLCVVWLASVGLLRLVLPSLGVTWHAEEIAHVIGVTVPAILSYLGHKRYTFRAAST